MLYQLNSQSPQSNEFSQELYKVGTMNVNVLEIKKQCNRGRVIWLRLQSIEVLEPGLEPVYSASRAQTLNLYTNGQVGLKQDLDEISVQPSS